MPFGRPYGGLCKTRLFLASLRDAADFLDYPVVAPATQADHRLQIYYPSGIKGSFAEVSYGTRRFHFEFPGTKVPGYFHSFLRNEPKAASAVRATKRTGSFIEMPDHPLSSRNST